MYSRALPTETPSPIFSEGRGRLYTGYLEQIIPSSNCRSKLTDKVRRIVPSKLKLFHFQIKKYYLSDAIIKRITRLTRIIRVSSVKTAISVIMNVAPRPWVGRLRVRFCFFTKIIFKLTIDISKCKIISEVKYFKKSMIYQMSKLFKRIVCFIPRRSEDLYFYLKTQKNTG